MVREQSRLSRRLEEQTKNQIIRTLIILGVIIIVLFFFGPSIIGYVGNILFKIQGNKTTDNTIVSKDFIAAPFLDPLPEATPSATITVKGNTQYKNGTVELFVNDTSYKDIQVNDDGTFKKENVSLRQGDNAIKARVNLDNKTSDFSQSYTVTYTKSAPKLDNISPSDGQQFQKADQNITVSGTTDPNNTVTVNDHIAIVNDDGTFSYYLHLNEGDNDIKIKATDQAGNTTEKDLKVNYKP